MAEIQTLEARSRSQDFSIEYQRLFDFFDQRLGPRVASATDFDRWWADTLTENPDLLKLAVDDLIDLETAVVDEDAFPTTWDAGEHELALSYEFDPASSTDGVCVTIPVELLGQLNPEGFEWNVPGVRAELVTALVRSLPKPLRKQFVPIPDTVAAILPELEPGDGSLIELLRRELTRRSGTAIALDSFDLDRLPSHLRPTFRVVNQGGETLGQGKDIAELRQGLTTEVRSVLATAGSTIDHSGMRSWECGTIQPSVSVILGGREVEAFPSLVDEGETVALRLLATRAEQLPAMWNGTKRLIALGLPGPAKALKRLATNDVALALPASPYESQSEWFADVFDAVVEKLLDAGGGPVWNEARFNELMDGVRAAYPSELWEIGQRSAQLLVTNSLVRSRLRQTTAPGLVTAVNDMEAQLNRLIYPNFLGSIGADRIEDVQRYVRGIAIRLEKVSERAAKDASLMAQCWGLENSFGDLSDTVGMRPDVIDIAWMLEEFRISTFAQTLGTSGPISSKRIQKAITTALHA